MYVLSFQILTLHPDKINNTVCVLQSTIDHRKLATDLAEVIIKWELRRVKEEASDTDVGISLCSEILNYQLFI